MKKSNKEKENKIDESITSNDTKIEEMEDWRDEHGQPSFKYLQSLAMDDDPESFEKLRSIAEDLDVDYGSETSNEILIRRILATQSDLNTTT